MSANSRVLRGADRAVSVAMLAVPGWLAVSAWLAVLASAQLSHAQPLLERLDAGQSGQVIVTMGTSLTAEPGQTGDYYSRWVELLRNQLDACYPGQATVQNVGVGSSSSDNADPALSGIERQLPMVRDASPDTVFIEFAINDSFQNHGISLMQSRANLNFIIDEILAVRADAEIILQTMNVPQLGFLNDVRPLLPEYHQIVRDVAASRGLQLIDHEPTWTSLRSDDPTTFDLWVTDGLHPNDLGTQNIVFPWPHGPSAGGLRRSTSGLWFRGCCRTGVQPRARLRHRLRWDCCDPGVGVQDR
jgi:lysophospholipase L1-like esterase